LEKEHAKALEARDLRIAALEAMVVELRAIVLAQAAKIAELEARLKQNSSNSSRPPSGDPPGAPPPASPKPKSRRRRGGQRGHKRHERRMVPPERIAETHELRPRKCRCCATALVGSDPDPHRHQVVDVPRVLATAIEYRLHALDCTACGATTKAALPEGVSRRVFGPRLVAMVGLLSGDYRLSKRLVEKILEDFFGIDISLGSVAKLEQETACALGTAYVEAAEAIRQSPVVNADETGWTENKRRAWLWVAVAANVVVFLIRTSRAGKVARELLGAGFRGILGSDRYSGYAWAEVKRRQVCWAHLKRDFASFANYGNVARGIGDNLDRERRRMLRWWRQVRAGTLPRDEFQKRMKKVEFAIGEFLRMGEQCGVPKVAGMCHEILTLESALFTFVYECGVEPTNNAAEQALRRAVIWRKVSFGTDSERGSRFVERILTATSTLRAQQRNVLEFLVETIAAHRRGSPTPSLLRQPQNQLALAA